MSKVYTINTGNKAQFLSEYALLSGSRITGSLFGTASWAQSSSVATSASFASIGPGTTNRIALFNSTNTISSSLIAQSGDSIGIGTTSPDQLLTIAAPFSSSPTGNIRFVKSGTNTVGGGSYIQFDTSLVATAQGDFNARIEGIRSSDSNGSSELRFYTTKVAVSNTAAERVRITAEGNVGIGTTSPTVALQVSRTDSGIIVNAGGSAVTGSGIKFRNDGYEHWTAGVVGTAFSVATSGDNGDRIWGNSPTRRLTITSTGLVGVGTTSPDANFTVDGQSSFNSGSVTNPGIAARGDLNTGIYFPTLDTIGFVEGGSEAMRIDSSGRVGVGTTSPSASFHVQGSGMVGGDGTTSYDLRLQRLSSGIRAITHNAVFVNNSPWYLHGMNLVWTGERAGTVDATHAHRPYYEAFAPAVGYKEFGFINLTTGNFTTTNLIPNIVLKNDGRVGIGTTNPGTALHVVGECTIGSGSSADVLVIRGRTSDNYSLIRFTSADGTDARGYIGSPADNVLAFFDGGFNEQIRLHSNGNFGIGTTNPSNRLQIQGNVSASSYTSSINNEVGFFGTASRAVSSSRTDSASRADSSATIDVLSGGSTTGLGIYSGSFFGTSSWAVTASNAITASYALNAGGATAGFPFSGSAVITGSLLISSSGITLTGVGLTGSVFGTSSFATSASFAPVGPGTTNRIALFNSTNTISSSLIVQSGDSIGVNTSSPTNLGAGYTTLAVNNTTAGVLELKANDVSQFRIFGNGTENRLHGVTSAVMTLYTNNTERVRIDSSGNVGIGTTNPGARLQISGSANSYMIDAQSSGFDGSGVLMPGRFFIGTLLTGYPEIGYNFNAFNGVYTKIANDTAWKITFGVGNRMDFANVGTGTGTISWVTRMSILSASGNVGIGTTNPNTRLQVSSNIQGSTPSAAGTATTSSVYFTNSDPGYGILMGVLNSGHGWIQAQRTDNLTTTYNLLLNPNGGNIGIGVTNPSNKLQIEGNVSASSYTSSISNAVGFLGTASFAQTGGAVANALTFSNTGNGAATGTTYNGSVARTISYNSVGAIQGTQTAYSTITSGSSGDWFPLFSMSEVTNGPVYCSINTYAHSSVSFVAVDGYGPSNFNHIVILGSVWNANNTFANISGVRITDAGVVQIRLTWTTGPTVDIDVALTCAGTPPALSANLSVDNSGTINDSVDLTTLNGYIRTENGYYGGTNLVLNANGASYLNGGNVGIGTTNPNYPLQVRRAGGAGSLGISIDNVGPTDRTVQYFAIQDSAAGLGAGHAWYYRAPSSTTDTFGMILDENGRFGIGTSSPSVLLDITGSTPTARVVGAAGTTPRLTLSSAGVTAWSFRTSGSDSSFRLDQDGTDRITVLSGGNVGIGTTSPAALLHVSASAPTNDLLVGTAATPKLVITDSGSVGIGIVPSNWWAGIRAIQFGQRGNLQSSNNTVALGFNSVYDTSSNFRYVASDYALEYRLNSANGSHAWFTAPQGTAGNTISFTQAMTLDASGSLGVNTTAPYGRAHIRNGSSGVPSASVNANALVVESNQSNGVAVLLPAASTGYYTFGDPTDNRRGGMVYLLSSAAGGERMEFWAGGTGGARMTILPTGNVGIGTQSPTAPLHVQGNVSASSYTSSISNTVGFVGTSSWAVSASRASSSAGVDVLSGGSTSALGTYSGSFSGSFFGNLTGTGGSGTTFPFSGSAVITGSLLISGSGLQVTGSTITSGSILPAGDNMFNLGSSTQRWANLYTGDLVLSNEGSNGNTVDGTTGNWTVQEGDTHLYIINNKSGKKYKFVLEEIT